MGWGSAIAVVGDDEIAGDTVAVRTRDGKQMPPESVAAFEQRLRDMQFDGATWTTVCRRSIAALPKTVYISFDIDGLTSEHCPHTGTPVPGGLTFPETCHLLEMLAKSGRRVIGFDLCEVAPSTGGDEWNGSVGARVLYKLMGCTLLNDFRREVKKARAAR
jgi:arginase family enzyme